MKDCTGEKISINLVTKDEDKEVSKKGIVKNTSLSRPNEHKVGDKFAIGFWQQTLFKFGTYKSTLAEAMNI